MLASFHAQVYPVQRGIHILVLEGAIGFATRWGDLPGLDLPLPEAITAVLPDDSSVYPISRALGSLLARLVLSGPVHNVLELGAGASSVVFAQALRLAGGGRLTTIEQDPSWCSDQWAAVTATPGIDAYLEVALPVFRLRGSFPCHLYATARRTVAVRGPYDLVFVDAPQRYYGRDGALPLVAGSLRPGALLVLDDAGRRGERATLHRWLQTYVGVELVSSTPFSAGMGLLSCGPTNHSPIAARCAHGSLGRHMLASRGCSDGAGAAPPALARRSAATSRNLLELREKREGALRPGERRRSANAAGTELRIHGCRTPRSWAIMSAMVLSR